MKKLFPVWLLFGALPVQAQMTNNGALQLHNGALMTIGNTLTNAAAGNLVNDGSLYLTGNLVNHQAAMTAGTGTLFLTGATAQTLSGTQTFKAFNLNTDNNSGITLNNDLSVSNVHTFTSGNIFTSAAPNYLSYEAGSSYSGAADNKHVIGWVKKSGTTDFSFPVGNANYLRAIGISSLSASSVFTAQYAGATPNRFRLNGPLVMVDPNEHWEINKISGGTAKVDMNWDHSKVAFPNWALSNVRAAQYLTEWNNAGGTATGSTTATGSISSIALSSFGQMTFGSTSFVLPVRFLEVGAQRINTFNRIKWLTAEEEQVAHYEIERQMSGGGFSMIGKVLSNNRRPVTEYQFDDADPLAGKIFYRVKSVDKSGSFSYSKIVSVSINGTSQFALQQNPVGATINLMTTALPAAKYSYRILSETGQVLQQGTKEMSGSGLQTIPLLNLPKGTYLLSVYSAKTDPFLTKILKQ